MIAKIVFSFRLNPSTGYMNIRGKKKLHEKIVCICGKTEKFEFDRGRMSLPSRCWWPAGWWEENVNSSGGLWLAGGGRESGSLPISKVLHWADQRAVQLHSDSPLRQVQRDKISLFLVRRWPVSSKVSCFFVFFISFLSPLRLPLLRCKSVRFWERRERRLFRIGPRMSVFPLLVSLLLVIVSPAAGQTGSDDPVTVDVGNRCIDDEGNPQVINRTVLLPKNQNLPSWWRRMTEGLH